MELLQLLVFLVNKVVFSVSLKLSLTIPGLKGSHNSKYNIIIPDQSVCWWSSQKLWTKLADWWTGPRNHKVYLFYKFSMCFTVQIYFFWLCHQHRQRLDPLQKSAVRIMAGLKARETCRCHFNKLYSFMEQCIFYSTTLTLSSKKSWL